MIASFAAQCAGEQDQFWDMHDWLFTNGTTLKSGNGVDVVKQAARDLGLEGAAFDACMDTQSPKDLISQDFEEGRKFGARGTPTFFINGRVIGGLLPTEQFIGIIDALLAEAESGELPQGVIEPTPTPTPDLDFEEETVTVMGDENAPVTIVEFSDYQCPFCLRYFQETMPLVKSAYVDTGKVRYVFKDFPITSIHPQAPKAAESAECAGEQDSYWEMHDRLFQGQQEDWNNNPDAVNVFKSYAKELGLDTEAFDACLDSGRYADNVAANLNEGGRAGVSGTPTFFINGEKLVGAQPFQAFQAIIDAQLEGE